VAETEILNVGGPQGVASEATLLKLIELTRQQQRGQSSAAQAEAKLRKTHNDSIKKGSENVGILGKAAQAGAKAFDTYTKVLKDGVGGVSDFTDSMKFLPSTMKSLIRFADASTHQFRELSQVGAGFSNSIFEMNKVAATSGMAMTDFYETVNANSTTMRFLSGSVQEGAKRFAEVSHGLRSSDLGETLFNMGFSIGEINEGFLTYTNNMQRQGMLQGMSNRELIEGSADYLKQIDLLAKATGASRKEFLNQTEALQESSQFQSLLARAGEGADDLTNNLAFAAQTLGGQFTDDLVQISSGTGGLTDLGIALQQVNGGRAFTDLMKNAENMDPNEFMRQFSALAPDIRDSIKSQFSPAEMRLLQGTPLGALFDTLGGFSRAAGINVDKIIEEQERRDAVTSAFAGFQQAVADLSKFITDNFLKSETFKSLKELGTSLSASFATLFGPVSQDGSFKNASDGVSKFVKTIDTFVKENLIDPITAEVNAFTAHMANNGDAGTYFKEKLTAAGNKILDFFLGAVGENEFGEAGRGKREGGLFSKVGNAISSVFEDEGFKERIKGMFSDVAFLASDSIAGWFDSEEAKATLGKLKNSILNAMGFNTEEGSESFFTQLKTRALAAMGFNTEEGSESFFTQLKTRTLTAMGFDTQEGSLTLYEQIRNKLLPSGTDPREGETSLFDRIMTKLFPEERAEGKSLMQIIIDRISAGMQSINFDAFQPIIQKFSYMFEGLILNLKTKLNNAGLLGDLAISDDQLAVEQMSYDLRAPGMTMQRYLDEYLAGRAENAPNGGHSLRTYNQRTATKTNEIRTLANELGIPERRIGTLRATGKTTEPNDTTAKIHAGERVLNPQEAASYNGQSDLGGAINRLNTTTAQLVTLMKQNNRITSGISNDFLKGSLTV